MKLKKITALALAGFMAVTTLAGCGINKNATAATMKDGVKVTMGVANFMCMYQQASTDEMYRQYGGDDVWNSDTFGMGSTNLVSTRNNVMDELHKMYTLQAHMKDYDVEITEAEEAKIRQAAEDFIAANDSGTLSELGANQEIVEEVLRLHTIESKVRQAFLDKTEVTDEEANMRAYTMVSISFADTESTESADEEVSEAEGTEAISSEATASETESSDEKKAASKASADAILKAARKGTDLDKAAKDNGQTTTTGTYDKDDETLNENVKKALDKLKEGEITDVIATDSEYVIARLDKETDKEATENNRKTIKNEKYDEKIEEWQKDDGWEVNLKQIEKIEFRNKFKTTDKSSKDSESKDASEKTTETASEATNTEKATENSGKTTEAASEKKSSEKTTN